MAQGLLDQLSQLIFTDDLTGLYNRRYMHYIMREAVQRSGGFPSMSLLVLDLDRFKTVNDTFGHADGDAILQQLAAILSESVPAGQTIVRYGGDEFTVILQGVRKPEAIQIGEEIRRRVLARAFTLPAAGSQLRLSVSVGVATSPEDASSFERLFESADKALYFSKKTGRGRVSAAGRYDPAQVLDRTVHELLGHPELVGRIREMDALRLALKECIQGQPRLLVLTGEAGSGKSRLLREAIRLGKDQEMIYAFTRCAEHYSPSPYKVLLNLVQVFATRHPETIRPQLAQLSDEVFSTVCEVIPDLAKVAERAPLLVQLGENQKRRYLFAALARIVWQLAQERSLMILIDNLHHIDQGTLEVIRWLLTARKARIMFVATLPAEVAETPAFKRSYLALFLEECAAETYCTTLTLEPLAPSDAEKLLRSLLPDARLPESFVSLLVDLSRGCPLFVTSAVRFLLTAGKIALQDGRWQIGEIDADSIPPSLEELLKKMFDTLDQEAVEFLTNAAVAGEAFHIDTVRGSVEKNEGQLLDVVDKLMRQNLVDAADATQSFAVQNFQFQSQKAHSVRYENIEEGERRLVHQRIGEVEERRLGADGADVLAHHFSRSGDRARSQKYQEELTRRRESMFQESEIGEYQHTRPSDDEARIPEGTKKLDEAGLQRVASLCRNLINTVKIYRVYPPTAPAVQQALQALMAALEEAFKAADILTLGQTEESLAVNGAEVPITAFDGYAGQVRIMFTEKYIKSLTFGSGLSKEELAGAVPLLAAKIDPQRILSDPSYWSKQLQAARVRRADIQPLVFVPESRHVVAEKDVDASLVEDIKGVLKSFKGSVEALRFYPPGSAVIKENIQNLLVPLGRFFQRGADLTISWAEKRLVVNTIPIDEIRFGALAADLGALMEAKGLTSITFARSVTAQDLDHLTRGLSSRDIATEAALAEFLNRQGVSGVYVGQATVSLKSFGARTVQVTETRTAAEQAQQWMKVGDEMFTGDGVLYQVVNLVDSLFAEERADLVTTMVQRFYRLLLHENESIAEGAAEAIDRLIHLGTRPTTQAAMETIRANALGVLSPNLPSKVRRHFIPMAQGWLVEELQAENWNGVAALLETLLSQPEPRSQAMVRELLERMVKEESFGPLYGAFRNPALRAASARSIRALGLHAEAPLIKMVRKASEPGLVEATALLLRELNPESWRALLKLAGPQTPAPECLNLLKALTVVARGQPEFGSMLATLFDHPDSSVKYEALKSADAADAASAARIVGAALASRDPALTTQGLAQAISLRLPQVADRITELLKHTTDEGRVVACCRYLGLFAPPEAYPELVRIYESRSRLFGIKKGLKDETRAAAVLAIASYRTPEAMALLEQATKEKSVEVKSAAKASLNRTSSASTTPLPGTGRVPRPPAKL
jgi:diguanylate cyclase (GGDEF)-like protein